MADVVKTVGSTGDYATWALWIASVPTNLVTSGNDNYEGQGQNQEFTKTSTLLNISGFTTDSTHKIKVTTVSGASWIDNASVRTNAYKYNASNGMAMRMTTNYGGAAIVCNNAYVEISKIQVKSGDKSSDLGINMEGASSGNNLIKDVIVQTTITTGFRISGTGCKAINVNVFMTGASGNGCHVKAGSKALGCSVIRDSGQTAAGTGAVSAYANSTLQSCAFFGFSTVASASNWDTTASKNCATDKASGLPGSTGHKYSVTYNSTSPFTNATNASLNLIPIASTDLIDNGFYDATDAPNDATGTARDSTPTIGSWEVTSSGGAVATTCRRTLLGVGV